MRRSIAVGGLRRRRRRRFFLKIATPSSPPSIPKIDADDDVDRAPSAPAQPPPADHPLEHLAHLRRHLRHCRPSAAHPLAAGSAPISICIGIDEHASPMTPPISAGEQADQRAFGRGDRRRLRSAAADRPRAHRRRHPQAAAAVPGVDDRQRRQHADEHAAEERGLQPCLNPSVVVLQAEMRDQLLTAQVAQRVLQLHQLDEQVVLGIELLARASGS